MSKRGNGEGSIYRRESDGKWVGSIHLGYEGGRRRRKYLYGRTRAEVAAKIRKLQESLDAGLPLPNDQLTVGTYLEDWLCSVLPTTVGENTVENYSWAVRKHLKPDIGQVKLRDLTPQHVHAMLARKVRDGMARNSIMRIRAVLVMALRHAERWGMVVRNVAALVDCPEGPRTEGRSLTADEATTFLAAIEGHRLEGAWRTMLMLGLRPGEVLGLRWDDVDLASARLTIQGSLKRLPGGRLELGEPKTRRSRRTLDLPQPVVAALQARRGAQAAERLRAGTAWSDWGLIFTTSVGTPIDPSNLRRELSKATTAAGLGHWSPNELRHSAVSLLSAAGVPLEQIADVVGHDGTRMTAGVYRHAVSSSVNSAVAPMEALFGT